MTRPQYLFILQVKIPNNCPGTLEMLAALLLVLTAAIYPTKGENHIFFFLINCINMFNTRKGLLNPTRVCSSIQWGKS